MRQQIIQESGPRIYRDFGHAPSKVRATIEAVVENHPGQSIAVVVELHTYSSMLADFIPMYAGVFDEVDASAICVDAHAFEIKKMPVLSKAEILSAFASEQSQVLHNSEELLHTLDSWKGEYDVILLLSSGNLMGVDVL